MYQNELKLAICAAKAAGEILRSRHGIVVDSAEGKDIKLSSDKLSEKEIIRILQEGSHYTILSEECGMLQGTNNEGFIWIIDPLDGTANYLKGLSEMTCVSIALWKNNEPVLGVVYRYSIDELYWGVVGEGAFCNNNAISTANTALVKQSVMATGFPVHRDYSTNSLEAFIECVQRFKKVRMFGAAAIMGTLVAAGKIDMYWEDHIMLWDIAAAAAIVSAAGGCIHIKPLENYMCICHFFANKALMEDFYAESV